MSIKLATGRVIPLADVALDRDGITFRYGVADVTYALTREQMRTFPGFDELKANAALSDAIRGESGGSTSVVANFFTGVSEDVSAIGFGVRDFVAGKEGATSDLKKVVYAAVILGGLYLVWQIAKSVPRK